jgi:hypothetical protein
MTKFIKYYQYTEQKLLTSSDGHPLTKKPNGIVAWLLRKPDHRLYYNIRDVTLCRVVIIGGCDAAHKPC